MIPRMYTRTQASPRASGITTNVRLQLFRLLGILGDVSQFKATRTAARVDITEGHDQYGTHAFTLDFTSNQGGKAQSTCSQA